MIYIFIWSTWILC